MISRSIFLIISFIVLSSSCSSNSTIENDQILVTDTLFDWCTGKGFADIVATKADTIKFQLIVSQLEIATPEISSLKKIFLLAARAFVGTPYEAGTLDAGHHEQLVVNLQGVDCVTVVEYSLAIALAIKHGYGTFEDFARYLTCVRYRRGVIEGYPSRFHYFSEWLYKKQQNVLLDIVNTLPGAKPHDSRVWFMTSRPNLYKQLENKSYLDEMAIIENTISSMEMNYLPKEKVQSIESEIYDGDIIAFVTYIEGLDVSHTGIAIHQKNRLYLLHASTKSNRVEICPVPLAEYILPLRNVKGILVGRLK